MSERSQPTFSVRRTGDSAHDQHRALGVLNTRVTRSTKSHATDPAVTTISDYQQVSIFSCVDQYLRGIPLGNMQRDPVRCFAGDLLHSRLKRS